jgi:putative acetyltransferase
VEASEAARRLFERRGFTVVRRRDLDLDGVAIHNFAMVKRLPV